MKILPVLFFIAVSLMAHSQQLSYTDPAQAYLKLMLEKGENSITRIGAFKVIGSPYLYGPGRTGRAYTATDSVVNTTLSYNTYTQEIEIAAAGSDTSHTYPPGAVKSFVIQGDPALYMPAELRFIYAAELHSTGKQYFQELYAGVRFSLYKSYVSELGTPESSYVQADLRQFQIGIAYYYSDNSNAGLKKLKTNSRNIIREFSKIKDLRGQIDDTALSASKDTELVRIFTELNK